MKQKNWFAENPALTWIIGLILVIIFISVVFPDKLVINHESESTELESVDDLTASEGSQTKEFYKVVRVIDGDTIIIENDEIIRLICIDTPERGEVNSKEATDYLEELILDREVKLVKDISERDRYGRLLRYVYTREGAFVNELIVKNGYGEAFPYAPDVAKCSQIKAAESLAKGQRRGIWAEVVVEVDE